MNINSLTIDHGNAIEHHTKPFLLIEIVVFLFLASLEPSIDIILSSSRTSWLALYLVLSLITSMLSSSSSAILSESLYSPAAINPPIKGPIMYGNKKRGLTTLPELSSPAKIIDPVVMHARAIVGFTPPPDRGPAIRTTT